MLDERLQGFCAGIVAGGAGVLVGHPFDTLKVKMQVASHAKSARVAATPSLWGSPSTLMALYRGVLPPLFSTGIVQSFNFGIFENSRLLLNRLLVREDWSVEMQSPLWSSSVAALISGAATSPLTAVVHKVKLIQQVQGKSTIDILRNIQNLQPLRHFPLHCTLESFGRGVYMTTYFGSKMLIESYGFDQTEMKWRIAAGALSGVVAWTAIYPLDVLRSRLYSGTVSTTNRSSAGVGNNLKVWSLLQALYREGALFRGLGFTLVRAAPVAGVVLTMYDVVLDRIRGGKDKLDGHAGKH